MLARDRELALAKRATRTTESLVRGTKDLEKLEVCQSVRVPNQCGDKPNRWDHTGTVVEAKGFDQYSVKLDGTGRITLRNKQF